MLDLHVLRLDNRQLTEAYPLVRSAARVAPACWHAFAREIIGAGGGVLGAQVDDKCLYGVAAFQPVATLRQGRALHIELLVAIELGGAAPAREALCANLAQIACKLGCESIVFDAAAGAHARSASASWFDQDGW